MVATGIPKLITADMVKEGVAVIDIGINRIVDEKTGKTRLVGDVDFEGKILYIYCTLLVVRGNTHVPSICLCIRSETIKVKPSWISDLITFSVLELYPVICR